MSNLLGHDEVSGIPVSPHEDLVAIEEDDKVDEQEPNELETTSVFNIVNARTEARLTHTNSNRVCDG